MINRIFIIFMYVFIIFSTVYSQNKFVAGGGAGYLLPIGELSNRFKSTTGFEGYFGIKTGSRWTWLGKIDYLNFNKVNYEKQVIRRKIQVGTDNKTYELTLPDLTMELESAGLMLGAKYNILNIGPAELNADLGFGIYRWTFNRGRYDSLTVDTSSVAGTPKYYYFIKDAPGLSQGDWSGGFNAGVELAINISDYVALTLNANYKSVLGELWAAMAFDMENVATMQMVNLSGSIRVKW